MARSIFLLIIISIFAGLEVYSYQALNQIFENGILFNTLFIASLLLTLWGIVLAFAQFSSVNRSVLTNFLIGFALTMFVSKLVFSSGILLQDIVRNFIGLIQWVFSNDGNGLLFPQRSKLVSLGVLGLAGIPFFSMLYGIAQGKYRYGVTKVKINIENLPEAFNGFTIAQISDIHSGSFDSIKQVEKGIQMVNDQKADLFVFTGDLVNFHKDEIDPYIESFSRIEAPFGRYSILGNHDYYGIGNVPKDQQLYYFDHFKKKHDAIGFELLRNEHVKIHKDGEHINLIGVENWGIGGFPKTGDLDKAIHGASTNTANVLLSHDPSHWDHKVLPHNRKIDLTLSGHTHGMQFGINLPNFKWSPVQYRYKKWMGLYEQDDQYLYVNRGFGFLGFPGRVFMWPEITIFELSPA